jgi:uncharacterized 2Fe-2S/4Fe-4S cluster protein (DUF4445 family)
MPTLTLKPTNVHLTAPVGAPLRDLLFEQGVEFPCGGQGRCRGCKVRLLAGEMPINDAQRNHLTPPELEHGWRLACQSSLVGDLTLELRQWDAAILGDEGAFHFTPRPGLGVAVDLGTTTLVAQLLDLQTSQVLAVRTAVNGQARHGADVMRRVGFAVAENGQALLTKIIRDQIGKLIRDLVFAGQVNAAEIRSVVIVGNTVMHHLFCGVSVEPLSHVPFESVDDGLHRFQAGELGWSNLPNAEVRFLPCLGSFVGSDILAGITATRIHASDELVGLVDLGTNGEIVIGTRAGLVCASTAAGPAFEGALISMGMRAATGAISEVEIVRMDGDRQLGCRVLGNVTPTGICGSGLVDAIACGLELELIRPNGRLSDGSHEWLLHAPVSLTQTDIRQLQLAKGAIAAGIHILLARLGATVADLTRLYLAGAFGNYINRASAQRIGLLPFPPERVQPAGNTALLGAKMALFAGDDLEQYTAIRRMTRHISLNEDPEFMEIYVGEMGFPG